MGALEDKARKARIAAKETGSAARDTARRNASTAKIKLTMGEEQKATKILKNRMQIDRSKTAARAVNIAKTQAIKTAAKRVAAATGNPQRKAASKPKPKAGPMETTRVGGIISIPKKPKKTVY